ncbi:MAG: ABC transporter permease [Burkholderiales bacterium]|nr:ABC transporter permease [Burkholderiales bacterium]
MKWRTSLQSVILPLALLALWHVATNYGWVSPQRLPTPLAVLQRWWAYLLPTTPYSLDSGAWWRWAISGELLLDIAASMYRVVLGFALGALLGLPLGLLMGANQRIYALCNSTVQVLRPIPPIAFIPLAMLWFGLGNPPAVFLIALGAFFPILMNTIAGVRQVDGIYLRAARNLGASQWTIFARVILPASTPSILTGVRVGIGTAFIVVIVAEMIAANNGLGFRISEAREYFWLDKILAGMLTIGMLGMAIDAAMNHLTNYLLRWHRGLEH